MKSSTRPAQVQRSPKVRDRRSPVTNRNRLHEAIYEVDGNAVLARRFRDVVDSLLVEFGIDDPTEAQFTTIRTIAFSTVRMEAMEAAHCAGKTVNDALYTRMVATLRIARAALGLDADDQEKSSDSPAPSMADLLATPKVGE